MHHGANITIVEDETLCHTYISISVDSLQGINQTVERLWEVIATRYHKQPSIFVPKPVVSLQSRFQIINSLVMYFVVKLSHVMTNQESGTNEIDWVKNYIINFVS